MRLVVLEVVQPSQRDHGPRTPALHLPTSRAYLQIHAAEGVPSDRLDHEHAEILAACQARDPERAASATRHHLSQTLEHVTQDLKRPPANH